MRGKQSRRTGEGASAEEDPDVLDILEARGRARWRRWAVGIGAMMWGCGFFVALVPNATRPELSGASSLFVVAFALPSYVVLWKWAGARRASQVLAVLGAFALGIESLAVITGWPYGGFSYGEAIGGKVAGLVPWTVPFAWTPLVLGTFALASRWASRWKSLQNGSRTGRERALQVLAGTVALVVADLVLDPGAVRQKFWAYEKPGLYYGVPLSNYFGWMLSGLVGHALLLGLLGLLERTSRSPETSGSSNGANPARGSRVGRGPASTGTAGADGLTPLGPAPAGLAVSLAWTLAFWSSVCFWAGLWAPAAVGHGALVLLWLVLRPARHSS